MFDSLHSDQNNWFTKFEKIGTAIHLYANINYVSNFKSIDC